jgi:hypothetical protein
LLLVVVIGCCWMLVGGSREVGAAGSSWEGGLADEGWRWAAVEQLGYDGGAESGHDGLV